MKTYAERPDDRVFCTTCQRRCKSPFQPLRCEDYQPAKNQADQRNGELRWPNLKPVVEPTGAKP